MIQVKYTAAIFLVDRAYGGSEEGGWWFDTGEPQFDLPIYACETEDQAQAAVDKLQTFIDEQSLNKGRRQIDSVLSTGLYRAQYQEGLPQAFPQEWPRYE